MTRPDPNHRYNYDDDPPPEGRDPLAFVIAIIVGVALASFCMGAAFMEILG